MSKPRDFEEDSMPPGMAGLTIAAILHYMHNSSGGASLSDCCADAEANEDVHAGEEIAPDMVSHSAKAGAKFVDKPPGYEAHEGVTA